MALVAGWRPAAGGPPLVACRSRTPDNGYLPFWSLLGYFTEAASPGSATWGMCHFLTLASPFVALPYLPFGLVYHALAVRTLHVGLSLH